MKHTKKLVKLAGDKKTAEEYRLKRLRQDLKKGIQKNYTVKYHHGKPGRRGYALFELINKGDVNNG